MPWHKGTGHKPSIHLRPENVLYAGLFFFLRFGGLGLLLQLRSENVLTFYWLTIGMLVGQPVVFGILELEVRVAQLALLGSEVFEVLGAVYRVAELILVIHSWAVLATVGGPVGNGATTERLLRMSAMHLEHKRKTTMLVNGCSKTSHSSDVQKASASCVVSL